MIQYFVDDPLVFEARVTLTGPPQRAQVSTSMLNTCWSRWAQVIAAWRSVGEEPSYCCLRLPPLLRPAGVISAS